MSEQKISATIKVELKPWQAPRFAIRHGANDETFGIPVAELDDDTLENMALAWVRQLYLNAGRKHAPFYKPAKGAS